jgi:5'-nucleotidase
MTPPLDVAVHRFREHTSRAPSVLVDMDEVLCRWDEHFIAAHRKTFPDLPVLEPGTRRDFDLFAGLSSELAEATSAVLRIPGFFADIPPVEGALDAVGEMLELGLDVSICTSPWLDNPTCASDKISWVERHLGRKIAARTIVTTDKTRVRGDVLIDDKPEVTGRMAPEWTLVRFSFAYNRHLPGPRIDSWHSWRAPLAAALLSRIAD